MENNFSSNGQLQSHLEEYKALRSEIKTRLTYQHNLLNWALVFFAAMSGIGFGYPAALSTLTQMRLQWILLFIPLIFLFIAFAYQEQYRMIADLGRYLNLNLRPKICSLLGITVEAAFAWEDHLSESRSKMSLLDGIACNARYILLIVMAIIWWVVFILITRVFLKVSWGGVDWTLVAINALLIGVVIYLCFPISARFRQITRSPSYPKGEGDTGDRVNKKSHKEN
ncbi:hypothetical protein ACFLVW_04375 [Chloroflexota bacterium]